MLDKFSITTKRLMLITLILLAWGYASRILHINFLWEAKSFGWFFFWITILFVLLDRIRYKKAQQRKRVWEWIGFSIVALILLVMSLIIIVVKQTGAYTTAAQFIKSSPGIKERVGDVKSISLVPYGGFSLSSNNEGSSGSADLYFIVNGSKKNMDLNIVLHKDPNEAWQIDEVK